MRVPITINDPYATQRMLWLPSGKLIEDANSTPQRQGKLELPPENY